MDNEQLHPLKNLILKYREQVRNSYCCNVRRVNTARDKAMATIEDSNLMFSELFSFLFIVCFYNLQGIYYLKLRHMYLNFNFF